MICLLKALIAKRRGNLLAEAYAFLLSSSFPDSRSQYLRLHGLISQSFFSLCRMEADKRWSKECGDFFKQYPCTAMKVGIDFKCFGGL